MTGSDLIDVIEGIVKSYTGEILGFYYGTERQCNEIADPMLPFVFVFNEPNWFTENPNFGNNTREISFTYAVFDLDKFDAPAKDTKAIWDRVRLIGEGVMYRLSEHEDITLRESANTLKLKVFDNAYSGMFFRGRVTVPDLICEYPFQEIEE